jgi:tetratricopeptide (TPR) repeat protein
MNWSTCGPDSEVGRSFGADDFKARSAHFVSDFASDHLPCKGAHPFTAAYARSIEVAKQQLAVNPGDMRALYLWQSRGHGLAIDKEAVAWARKALALDSQDSAVLYNVACLYGVLRRTEDALNCLRRVALLGSGESGSKTIPI